MVLTTVHERRYDVDWLRSLAFLLLILYHVGMYYVADWGWHIKSPHQSDILKNFMLFSNQWRMPLLFLLSGIALRLVEPKISSIELMKTRFVRIFMPLAIGMYLIVPPQLYFELQYQMGFDGSYSEFFGFYIDPNTTLYPEKQFGPLGLLTWNHLWYLAYLWAYTLMYLGLKPAFQFMGDKLSKTQTPVIFVLITPVLFSVTYSYMLGHYPRTNAFFGDWHNHADYFTVFVWGYLLASSRKLWEAVITYRRHWLGLGITSFILILLHQHRVIFLPDMLVGQILTPGLYATNAVSWILCLVGFAGYYLNRPSGLLSYLNTAILPWYILHQTVIIVVAMYLRSFNLHPGLESIVLISLTIAFCAIGYELIRRTTLTRFMFGLRNNNTNGSKDIQLSISH